MAPSESNDTATRILDSVMQLILAGGLPAVTLSAVCRHAKLSKGGLVHHYPTKESLVEAFVQRASDQYWSLIDQLFAKHPGGVGRRARAFVDMFLGDPAAFAPQENRDCAAVMTALIQGGGRTRFTQNVYSKLIEQLRRDGLSLEMAELIVVSVDGMWLQSMIEPLETIMPRAARVRRRLRKLIEHEIAQRCLKSQEKAL